MIELTEDQVQAVISGEPVRFQPPEIGKKVVLVLEEHYERMRELLADEHEKEAWAALARKARDSWAKDNAY